MKSLLACLFSFAASAVWAAPDDPFADAVRTWTDLQGREIQAVFRGIEGEKIKLEKNGQVYLFPITRLRPEDQTYARSLVAPAVLAKPVPPVTDPGKPAPLSDLELQVAPEVRVKVIEEFVLQLVNESRKTRKLNALGNHDQIAKVARSHSLDMATRGFFSHDNPDGENPTLRAKRAGFTGLVVNPGEPPRLAIHENIGRVGRYASFQLIKRDGKVIRKRIRWQSEAMIAQHLFDGWMASPPHRANILDPAKAYIGVGVHVHREHVFATQNFF